MKKTGHRGPSIQIGIRIPQALHQRLVAIATTERRSLNDQILHLMETGCRFYPTEKTSLLEMFAAEVKEKQRDSSPSNTAPAKSHDSPRR